jgi:hypothetical protein
MGGSIGSVTTCLLCTLATEKKTLKAEERTLDLPSAATRYPTQKAGHNTKRGLI